MNRPRVTIIGVGLMGGSLGMSLVRSRKWRVVGVGRNPARLQLAKTRGGVHEYTTDLADGVRGASVVVVGVPVDRIVPIAERAAPHIAPGALVMDLGGVKGPVVRRLERVYSRPGGPRFIGAHPLTGSEKTGVEHARNGLYRGSPCVVTPGKNASPDALRRAERFWRALGSRVFRLTPEDHDRWVALSSHLPHLLADALVLLAGGRADSRRWIRNLAAGSFRDMTRVAGADPDQWAAIFRLNSAHVDDAAKRFCRILQTLANRKFPASELRRAGRLRKDIVP